MGRNAQPIGILQANGKKHLTKAEIDDRKNTEVKLGNKKLICPGYIKNNVIAYSKWKEIIKIYKDVDFISSSDSGVLARYCTTFSEYRDLLERRNRINSISENSDNIEDYIENNEEFNRSNKKQLNDMISTNAILQLDTAINRKMDMLIKMEDRLFLNPLAKVKNVAKPPEKKAESKFARFGAASG